MGAISELDAVNFLLEAAGESLVTTLSGVDVTFAQQLLDRYRRDYQLRGTSENQYIVKVYPDVSGNIVLPTSDTDDDGILDAELLSRHYNSDGYPIRARVQGRTSPVLYNITDDTDVWDQNTEYTLFYTKLLKWDNLSTPLQRAIIASAARRYQATVMGDAEADMFLAQEENMYYQLWKAEDIQDRRANLFLNGPSYLQKFHPYNRNRYGAGDPARYRFWRGTTS